MPASRRAHFPRLSAQEAFQRAEQDVKNTGEAAHREGWQGPAERPREYVKWSWGLREDIIILASPLLKIKLGLCHCGLSLNVISKRLSSFFPYLHLFHFSSLKSFQAPAVAFWIYGNGMGQNRAAQNLSHCTVFLSRLLPSLPFPAVLVSSLSFLML